MQLTAHLREHNSSIGWGGVDSRAVCIATGHLCGVTFCKSESNKWSKVLITSGNNDAWVIPTAARMLFSQVRAKKQGHRCILDGLHPGLFIGDTGDFIPFVIEEETQFHACFLFSTLLQRLPQDMQVYTHRLCAFSILKSVPRRQKAKETVAS